MSKKNHTDPADRTGKTIDYPLYDPISQGFTLVELIIIVAIVAILASIAIPYYRGYRDKANNSKAIADVQSIGLKLTEYFSEHNTYPTSLSAVGMQNLKDSWKNPYVYLNAAPPTKKGKLRKD